MELDHEKWIGFEHVKMKSEMVKGSTCLVKGVARAGRLLVKLVSY